MVILCCIEMLGGVLLVPWSKKDKTWSYFDHRRRQHQCTKTKTVVLEEEEKEEEAAVHIYSSYMVSSSNYCKISPIISFLVFFLFISSSVPPVFSSKPHNIHQANQTFRPGKEVHKLKLIKAHLNKINKPSVKTIQAYF